MANRVSMITGTNKFLVQMLVQGAVVSSKEESYPFKVVVTGISIDLGMQATASYTTTINDVVVELGYASFKYLPDKEPILTQAYLAVLPLLEGEGVSMSV